MCSSLAVLLQEQGQTFALLSAATQGTRSGVSVQGFHSRKEMLEAQSELFRCEAKYQNIFLWCTFCALPSKPYPTLVGATWCQLQVAVHFLNVKVADGLHCALLSHQKSTQPVVLCRSTLAWPRPLNSHAPTWSRKR